MSVGLFSGHFQNAYVVRNAERAMARFRTRFGVAEWEVLDMVTLMGPDSVTRFIANAYVGDTMIELIEPFPERPSLYQSWIPDAADAARLHHLGFMVHDAAAFQAAVDQLNTDGFPVANAGSFGEILDFHYADTTADLGHFYELVHLKPAGASFFSRVPRN